MRGKKRAALVRAVALVLAALFVLSAFSAAFFF